MKKSFQDSDVLKAFEENPAATFISKLNEEENAKRIPIKEEIPKGFKINPKYVETRSRRVQLVVQPSLFERVKAAADKYNVSVNDYIHQVLDQATRES